MKADWIAVDWGTTNLRAYAMGPDGIRAEATSEDGMGRLGREGFEPALIRLIEPWLGPGVTSVLACGMVGSRQGWFEAPYRATPCTPVLSTSQATAALGSVSSATRDSPG
jgi:2-dehydro-3-deoxygalactonokinase